MPAGLRRAVRDLLDSFTCVGAGATELEAHRIVLAPEGTGDWPPDGRDFTAWAWAPQLPLSRFLWLWPGWWRVWGSNHLQMCCPELLTQPPWSLVLQLSNEESGSGDLHGTCIVRSV